MAGIGIIANPYSKLNRRNPDRTGYLSYIAGKKGHVAVTKSLQELNTVAEFFKKQKISILAINGGDGTISQTLTIFSKVYQDKPLPQIALLRGGTMNVLANNLKIKGSPENLLYRLIEKHSTGEFECVQKRCLVVDDQIGFLFANGTPANFLEKFYQNKSSALGAAWLVARVVMWRFINHKMYKKIVSYTPCSIYQGLGADRVSSQIETISVLISTLPRMPMGPMLFPKMGDKSEKNHAYNKAQLVAYCVDPIKASYKVPIDAFIFPAKQSSIKFSLVDKEFIIESQTPVNYTLDGELYYPKNSKVHIEVGKKINFIII